MLNKCVVCGNPAVTEWREYNEPTIWTCAVCYPESRPVTLTVVAPAFYSDCVAEAGYKVRYLAKSAIRCNVPIFFYGLGKEYTDWFNTQILFLLEELHRIQTSHVLYTDASDAILLAGLEEIQGKYVAMGCPELLMSVEKDSKICAGGWMGNRLSMIKALEFLQTFRPKVEDPDNPQVRWRQAVAGGYLKVKLDHKHDIFQVADQELTPCLWAKGRLYNPRTNSYPCILHFAGGYTDPIHGKAALIEPLWKELGYPGTVA